MLTKELKNKLMNLLEYCSDSDIEDFIDENNLTSDEVGEVWEIVAINNAPNCCKDCKNVKYYKYDNPCYYCIRPKLDFYKDYYEKKQ